MQLSVVIVSFNTLALLRECLTSVFQYPVHSDFEVIVVDNGSTDDTQGMLTQFFPKVKTIFNTENLGFAAANNQGIGIARGSNILLLNSDTCVLDAALDKVLQFMQQHRSADIVGCRLVNADGSLQPSCRSFPSVWNLFCEAFFLYKIFGRTRLFGSYHMSHFKHDETREVDVVMGAFMMIRREVFEKIGMLDESYHMYTEETDFCFRAKQNGFSVFFVPDAQVIHHGGASRESTRQRLQQIHLSQIHFVRKNFAGLNQSLGVFLKVLAIVLRVPVYLTGSILTFDKALFKKTMIYLTIIPKLFR